jgi:hypothetical protein
MTSLFAKGTKRMVTRVERYTERAGMLRRQHELLCAWKAQGWRELEEEPAGIRR